MSDPLVSPDDLAVLLSDKKLNVERALGLIEDAQTLCESIVTSLPAGAAVVVKRMAAAAYAGTISPRDVQIALAGGQYVEQSTAGGVRLTTQDIRDLRRFANSGGAFTIDFLPVGYTAPVYGFGVTTFDGDGWL